MVGDIMSYWNALRAYYSSTAAADVRIDSSTDTIQTIDYEHHEIHDGSHFYLQGYIELASAATFCVKLVTPASTKWSHFVFDIKSTGICTSTLDGNAAGMTGGDVATIHANNRNKDCWVGTHTPAGSSNTVLTDSTASWTVDALIGYQVFNTTDKSSGIITDNDATTVTVAALAGGTDNDFDQNDVYEINKSRMVITTGVTTCTSYLQRLENDKWGSDGFKENIGGGSGRSDEIVLKQDTTYCRSFISGAADNIIQFKASWYEHTDKH